MSAAKSVEPEHGTGDLFADAGMRIAKPRAAGKGDTAGSKPTPASAWAWCPHCGPGAARRVGLVRGGSHYTWRGHNRQRDRGASVICQASGTALCDVPPTRCAHCLAHEHPCPGEHREALLLRAPDRTETARASADTGWQADRIPHPIDGTCIGMHEARTAETTA